MSVEPMVRVECPICEKWVDEGDTQTAYYVINHVWYHAKCYIMEMRLDQAASDIGSSFTPEERLP